MQDHFRKLTREQVESYERDGFLAPINVLTADELEEFHAELRVLERRHGSVGLILSQPHLHYRWAYELATHPDVLDAVEDILGPDLLIHSSTTFNKAPRDATYVSWHQDGHYWGLSEPAVVSAWIAFTVSTSENGCLRVLPGSHREGSLPHNASAAGPGNLLRSGLELALEVDADEARDVTLRPGQMSLHHVYTVHGSNPNQSSLGRKGFAVRYLAPRVSQESEHHEVIVARGRDDYHHYAHAAPPAQRALDESMAADAAFARRLRAARRAQGRADS